MQLSEAQIDPIWRRVMDASIDEWTALEAQCVSFQEHLTVFVMGHAQRLGGDAQVVTQECALACISVYREHLPSLRPATEAQILAQWDRSRARMADAEALVLAGEPPEQILSDSAQPRLLGTVLAAAMGPDPDHVDAGDVISLEDHEFWQVLALFDMVIAVLEECVSPPASARTAATL